MNKRYNNAQHKRPSEYEKKDELHTNLKKIGAVLNDVRLYYQVSSNKSNIIGQRIRGSKSINNLKCLRLISPQINII